MAMSSLRGSVRDSVLMKEFECPICCEEFEDPKVLTECQHSLCKVCLQTYLAQFQMKKTKHFPCPVCRTKCALPKNGVDGIKDNFTLKSIMVACSTRESTVPSVACGACCRADASHYCQSCEGGLYMCQSCLKAHKTVAATADHEVIGICTTHNKPLTRYCETCQCPICQPCLISSHADPHHKIIIYRELVAGIRDDVSEVSTGFQEKIARLDQERSELHNIHQEANTRVDSVITEVNEKADSAIGSADREMKIIRDRVGDINNRIKALEREKEVAETRYTKVQWRKDLVYEKKVELVCTLRSQRDICSNDMTGTLEEVEDISGRMDLANKTWEELKSDKTIDASTYERLMGLKRDMLGLSAVTDTLDRAAPFRNVAKRFAEFVPDPNDIGLGYLCREFTCASKKMDLFFPKNKGWYKLKKVVHLPNGRISALGHNAHATNDADTLYLWRIPATSPSSVIREPQPIVDMVATSAGNLVLLRRQNPALRILFTNGGGRQDITVNLEQALLDTVCCIDYDDNNNFFVMYGRNPLRHLMVVDEAGTTLQDFEIVSAVGMSFCRSTEILFVASPHVMLKFRWQSTAKAFEVEATNPHGSGHDYKSICASNNGGEMFTVVHKNGDPADQLRVYQIIQQKAEPKEKMKKIHFPYDQMVSSNFTSFCVRGDHFVVAYEDRIEVFQMI